MNFFTGTEFFIGDNREHIMLMLLNDFIINKWCPSMTAVKKRTVFVENCKFPSKFQQTVL
jgi:hypothetical protein